jgi:peptidoglycan/LPS O-acetylase OafA/YrhL
MKENVRINSISILRVIATFMVVTVHFCQELPLPKVLKSIVSFGPQGVIIFFLISGYLIAYSLDKNASVGSFYAKRVIRIVPIYYAVVTCLLIVSLVFHNFPTDVTHLGWLRYYLFLNGVIPSDSFYYWNNAAAFWTIPSFMFFYLVAPLVHWIVMRGEKGRRIRLLVIFWGGVFLSVISEQLYLQIGNNFGPSREYLSGRSPFAMFFVFLIGMVFYYYQDVGIKTGMISVALVGIIGYVFEVDRFFMSALLGTLVYLLINCKVNLGKRIGKVVSKLDEYSFTIYLGHAAVMFTVIEVSNLLALPIRPKIIAFVFCLVIIPMLHELVEKPSTKALKKLLVKF